MSGTAAPPARAQAAPLVRDRPTLLAYGGLAMAGYAVGAFGPALALLRHDLQLGDLAYAAHPSLLSLGVLLSGAAGARPVRRLGRDRAFRLALWGLAAAAVLLALAPGAWLSLPAAGLYGLTFGVLLSTVAAELRVLHGDAGGRALGEGNAVASVLGITAPAILGGLVGLGLNGRGCLLVPLLALLPTLVRSPGRLRGGESPQRASEGAAGRSFAAWSGFLLLADGLEVCALFWTAPLLEARTGLSAGAAASALTAFFVAQALARLAGGRVLRRRSTASVLAACLALAVAGLAVLGVAETPAAGIAGLVLASVGIANLYPLGAAATVAAAHDPDHGAARVSLLVGVTGLVAPLVLGALADAVGLRRAWGMVPAFAAAAAVALLVAVRRERESG